MKKFLYSFLLFCLPMFSAADTLVSDITAQGNESYLHKTITAQMLASTLRNYEDVTATNVITYSECGTTYFLNSATEFVSTLPAPQAGCQFTFIVKAAPVGAAYTVVTASNATIINGLVVVNGASVTGASEDTITFAASAAIAGDWVTVESDGTYWFVRGQGHAAGAITLTDAA